MNGKLYFKNKLPVLVFNILCMLALSLFLLAVGNTPDSVLLILLTWCMLLAVSIGFSYYKRKREMDKLLHTMNQLKEQYLIAELIKVPERADDRVFLQLLKMAEKSMLEEIGIIRRERTEYKEYIEQWIHEIKTPITAMKLLCENNRSSFTRDVLAELEKITHFTEQALYYARSEHTEKDYSIREIRLFDIVHSAIADNKYLLVQNQVTVTVTDSDAKVFSDEKWIRFILDQLIVNAVKYRTGQPALRIYAKHQKDQVRLFVADNGMGIPSCDLPRIFEKGFTGQNGRIRQESTGIGLYLCKRLCDKLGLGLSADSDSGGTTIILTFYTNHFIHHVQG